MNETWGKSTPLADRWPKTSSGEAEKAVFLCNCKALDFGDELLINMLEAYGIPCLRDYPGDGSFGKVVIGMSGQGTDIYVPESMLEEARNICKGGGDHRGDRIKRANNRVYNAVTSGQSTWMTRGTKRLLLEADRCWNRSSPELLKNPRSSATIINRTVRCRKGEDHLKASDRKRHV